MRPDGINEATLSQQPTLIERIDAVDIKNTNQLSETLAGLREDANIKIEKAFADKKITNEESRNLSFLMSRFCSLNGQIKTAMRNAGEELKNLYEQLSQSLSATIDRLTKASNGINPSAQAVIVSEPEETDSQKPKKETHMSEENWLASVSSTIKETYLRIVKPEEYQGHGGPGDIARKSYNAKIGGLQGIIKNYNSELNREQVQFLKREIQRYEELAKIEKSPDYSLNNNYEETNTHYGSHFYDNPENGKELSRIMHGVYTKEGLTLTNARKVIGLDDD